MKQNCKCKELTCEKNCTRNHTHKTFYCEKCLNKITKQYQKGVEKLASDLAYEITHNKTGFYEPVYKHVLFDLQNFITETVLQSEYDRLEGEKREIYKEGEFLEHRNEHNKGCNTAIADQQNHLIETINEIKGL